MKGKEREKKVKKGKQRPGQEKRGENKKKSAPTVHRAQAFGRAGLWGTSLVTFAPFVREDLSARKPRSDTAGDEDNEAARQREGKTTR